MNTNEKQRLWSKYYLTHSTGKQGSWISLVRFVYRETEAYHLSGANAIQKKKKIFRFMLRSLTKSYILKRYCPKSRREEFSQLPKNKLIEKLIEHV